MLTATVGPDAAADTLVLDTRDLVIESCSVDGVEAAFELQSDPHPVMGTALTITLPGAKAPGSTFSVAVAYRTTPESSGLQWLRPEQTCGRESPVSLLAVPGDPRAVVLPVPGRARGEDDVRGRGSPRRRRSWRSCPPCPASPPSRCPWRTACARSRSSRRCPFPLLAGARGGQSRGQGHRAQEPSLERARDGRRRRVRVRRDRGVPGRRRERRGPVRVGPVRSAAASPVVPVRGHGEPVLDVRDAHAARGRPVAGARGCARDRALVERQPRDERDVGVVLAQRGFHRVHRAEDHARHVR